MTLILLCPMMAQTGCQLRRFYCWEAFPSAWARCPPPCTHSTLPFSLRATAHGTAIASLWLSPVFRLCTLWSQRLYPLLWNGDGYVRLKVGNFCDWHFFPTQHNSLELHASCCVYQLFCSSPRNGCTNHILFNYVYLFPVWALYNKTAKAFV